jgi:hypothetical protein
MIDNDEEVKNYIDNIVYLYNKLCIEYNILHNNSLVDHIQNNEITYNNTHICSNLIEEPIYPDNTINYIIIYLSIISILLNCITCMVKCYNRYKD